MTRCDREGHRLDYLTRRCKVCGKGEEQIMARKVRVRQSGLAVAVDGRPAVKARRVKGVAGY